MCLAKLCRTNIVYKVSVVTRKPIVIDKTDLSLTECEKEAVGHAEDPGVPAPVFLVDHRVDGVTDEEWKQGPRQVLEGHL